MFISLLLAEVVKLLLAAGADRNRDVNGMRPIDLARRENKPEVVALLLSEGQPNWGSGQPRRHEPGTTSKAAVVTRRIRELEEARDEDDDDGMEPSTYGADPRDVKAFTRRERMVANSRLLKMKARS